MKDIIIKNGDVASAFKEILEKSTLNKLPRREDWRLKESSDVVDELLDLMHGWLLSEPYERLEKTANEFLFEGVMRALKSAETREAAWWRLAIGHLDTAQRESVLATYKKSKEEFEHLEEIRDKKIAPPQE